MAKKKSEKKNIPQSKPALGGLNPENYKYYFPILAVIILVGVVILFADFLFSDDMLYGSDTIVAGIFFRHFYVDYFLSHWSVPLWNPYIYGGMPFIDAFHGDTYYPLSAYKFIGDFYRSLGLNLVLHIFLAGLFMYGAARQFGLSKVASTLSAVVYGFSGFLVSLVAPGHDGKIFVTTLFPLTMLFLDRAFHRKPILNFTLLGLVIGLIILSPHPQLSYYTLWALAFYGIFKLVLRFRETKAVGAVVKPGVLLSGAVALGLMISAVQFFPGYFYTTHYSPRADTKQGYEWATSWSLHAEEAAGQFVPEFAGVNAEEGGNRTYYWGKNAFKDNSEYAGVIGIFLALLAVIFARRKETWFFFGLGLFVFIYALGDTTPLFKLYFYLIPKVKALRAPGTIMFVFVFCVAILSGYGIQYLIDKSRELSDEKKKQLKIYLLAFPGVVLLLAFLFSIAGETLLSIWTSIFYSDIKTISLGQNFTKWNLALMNLGQIQTGFWIASILLIGSALAAFLYISRKAGVVVLLFIPLLGMIDGIRYNSKFVKTYDYRQEFSSNPLIDAVKKFPGYFRIANFPLMQGDQGMELRANFFPFFGIPVVTGYHGNQLRWYDDLLGGPSTRNKYNPNFLNLVGAKYIYMPGKAQLPPDYFGPDSLKIALTFGGGKIYENDNALPRAFLVNKYKVIEDRKDIYPELLEGKADMRKVVYLEEKPPPDIIPVDSGTMRAEIVSYDADSVLISIQTDQNAMLVLTDNYYPKWQAFVDGEKANIYRAYGTFRAVPVKAGNTSVLFKYDKSANAPYFWITFIGFLIVAAVLLFYLYKYYRERRVTEES